jgi:hypothetical protein
MKLITVEKRETISASKANYTNLIVVETTSGYFGGIVTKNIAGVYSIMNVQGDSFGNNSLTLEGLLENNSPYKFYQL